LIIDRPDLQARHRRVLYSTATMAAWALWMYLWLPLVTLVAWWLGATQFVGEIVVPETRTMLRVGVMYFAIVLCVAAVLVGWSRYNLRRYGSRGRRQAPPVTPDAAIAAYFRVSDEDLRIGRGARTLVIHHTDAGEVERMDADVERALRVI
jgi:poly-beta-1,6-N-acetyl-D-glucosamine biosynthesis protein PgaD